MEPTEAEDLYDATFIEHPVILDKYKAAAVITNGKSSRHFTTSCMELIARKHDDKSLRQMTV